MITLSRTKKFVIAGSMLGALAAGTIAAGFAGTDTDDNLSPANTAVTASLKSGTDLTATGTINGTPVNLSCTSVTAAGKTPAKGLTVTLPNPPQITGCTALGFPATVTTNQTNGKWKLTEVDLANDETGTEPNSTGDKAKIVIPKAGATFSSPALPGCTVIVDASAPGSLNGSYNDAGTATIKNSKVNTTGQGCTTGATGTISATLVLSKPVYDAG